MIDRYKELLKERGLTGKDMSGLLGLNYDGYRKATMRGVKRVPTWVRSFVVACELSDVLDSGKNRVLRTEEGNERDVEVPIKKSWRGNIGS